MSGRNVLNKNEYIEGKQAYSFYSTFKTMCYKSVTLCDEVKFGL